MFVYELDEQSDSTKGTLVWTGARSQFSNEPRMRVLLRDAPLVQEIFAAADDRPVAGRREVPA